MSQITVPADAFTSGPVAGDFTVIQWTNWNTTWWVVEKTGSQWEIAFSTPAPSDGSGIVAYLGTAPPGTGTVTLQDYLDRLRRLLHDQGTTNLYWSTPDLIADINIAIRQRDMWSGGSLSLQEGIPLTIGQDIYSLGDLFPELVVLDVINIWLIYGQTRIRLNNPTMTTLTSEQRALTGLRNRPVSWARRGPLTVYIAPKPSVAYTCDWDLAVLSTTLVNPGDIDPLIYPYTEPVVYYAAAQACINARRWDLVDRFKGEYLVAMRDIEGSRVGEMVDYYAQSQWPGRRPA